MSKIKIKNFGPIKEGYTEPGSDGFMDVKKVTLFIGNQGSGKSVVAKLISTFTWMEKALFKGDIIAEDITKETYFKDTFCRYHRLQNYFRYNFVPKPQNKEEYRMWLSPNKPDSEIHFIGSKYEFHYHEYELEIKPIKPTANYPVPKVMYVPSERNFVSSVENPDKVKGLPKPLYEFLAEYDRSIKDEELLSGLNLPIGNIRFIYRKEFGTTHVFGNDYYIRLLDASSGIQSFAPLYLVSRNLAFSIGKEPDLSKKELSLEEEKRIGKERQRIHEQFKDSLEDRINALKGLASKYKNSCFINIIEEPEQNLFPSSQRQMLNSLLEFNNMSPENKLIMTTHSPYLINYLSLAIEADKLKGKVKTKELEDKLKKIVPFESTVNQDEEAIYELDETRGTIKLLPKYNGLPSDENYLNEGLSEGNQWFSDLLEIEDQCL